MDRIKFLFIIAIFSIAILGIMSRFLPSRITGFAVGNASISINEELKGEITAIFFKENIEFKQPQNISIEFTNIGSLTLSEKIEVRIYYNQGGSLQLIAYYFDTQNTLNPGMSRTYSLAFYPPIPGTYYIKFKVLYEGKVIETWKAFLVTYTPTQAPPEIIWPSWPSEPLAPPPAPETGVASMDVEYPETIEITQGDTMMFAIRVINSGTISLTNLRLYILTTDLISLEMNPKQVFRLYPNDTVIFLLSITVPENTTEGTYPFRFDVLTDQIKESRNINFKITSVPQPVEEDLYKTILNYEYMISEIQNEINATAMKNIDVSQAQATLDKAKAELEMAKLHYEQKRYDEVKRNLENVKKYLEDAVYQLSVAGVTMRFPAFANWYIIIIVTIIGIFFIIFFARRRKKKEKEERPRLLRGLGEGET